MPIFFDNPFDVSITTTGSYQTIALSTYIPLDATIVILRLKMPGGSPEIRLRPYGASADPTATTSSGNQLDYYVEVGSGRRIEAKVNINTIKIYLAGYFTNDGVPFPETVKNLSNGWNTLDLSAEVGSGAVYALFRCVCSSDLTTMAFRRSGSADNRPRATVRHFCIMVGLDTAKRCQVYTSDAPTVSLYLIGYVDSGRSKTVGIDVSLSTTGSYQAIDTSSYNPPWRANGVLVEVSSTGTFNFALREAGSAFDVYCPAARGVTCLVGLDTALALEGKIASLGVDFYILGYTTPPYDTVGVYTRHRVGEFVYGSPSISGGQAARAVYPQDCLHSSVSAYEANALGCNHHHYPLAMMTTAISAHLTDALSSSVTLYAVSSLPSEVRAYLANAFVSVILSYGATALASGSGAYPAIPEGLSSPVHTLYEILQGKRIPCAFAYSIVNSDFHLALYAADALGMDGLMACGYELSGAVRAALYSTSALVDTTRLATYPTADILARTLEAHYATYRGDNQRTVMHSHQVDVYLDGVPVTSHVAEVRIRMQAEKTENEVEVEFADMSFYDFCDPEMLRGDERIVVFIDDDEYRFLLEIRGRNETYLSPRLSISGGQRPGVLTERFTTPLQVAYREVMASLIAVALAADIPLEWGVDDYYVPEFSHAGAPLSGLVELAVAAGGVVRSTKPGALLVRPKVTVRPADVSRAAPERQYDRSTIFSLDESAEEPEFNSVTVAVHRPEIESVTYSIEADSECHIVGRETGLRVYSSAPGRPYGLCSTESAIIMPGPKGVAEEIEEVITIANGRGSTRKGVVRLLLVEGSTCSGECLPEPAFTPGRNELVFDSVICGMATVRYQATYDLWTVRSDVEGEVLSCLVVDDRQEPLAVQCITGKGDREGAAISHPLILTLSQALIVGQTALDDSSHRKLRYSLSVPYDGVADGAVVAIDDDRYGVYRKGIVRSVEIVIARTEGLTVSQDLDVVVYEV